MDDKELRTGQEVWVRGTFERYEKRGQALVKFRTANHKDNFSGVPVEDVAAGRAAAPAAENLVVRFRRLFGADLSSSHEDTAFIQDAAEIYNDGFEAAHALRKCGHSVGDYRDSNYVPGKPETYTASERCIGCEREDKLKATSAVGQVSEEQVRQAFRGLNLGKNDPFPTDRMAAALNALLRSASAPICTCVLTDYGNGPLIESRGCPIHEAEPSAVAEAGKESDGKV